LDSFIIAGNFILLNGLIGLFLDQFGLTLRTALTAALEHEGELQREINHRTQAEEALRANQTKFQGLFDSSPDAIIVGDSQGKIVQVNTQVEVLFGYSAEELLGQPIETLLPERFHEGHAEHRAGDVAYSRPRMMGLGLELYGRRKDGSEFAVDINLGTLETEAGRVVLSTVRDITERKRAEETLREKERLLSEAQRIGRIGSWSYDILADALVYTDEMYSLLDISPDGFQHNREAFLSLIHSPDHSMVASWLDDIRVRGQAKEVEFLIFRKNGELRYIRCRGAVEFGTTGNPVRFIGTAQDVTERKLAEIQIRQQVERLLALRKIDQAISSSFDLTVTLDVLVSQVISQLQVDAADVLLFDNDTNMLHYAAGRGFRTDAIESARLHMADNQTARERRSIHVQSLKFKPDVRLLTTHGASEEFDCYFGVPLVVKGRVKGVLEVFHRTPLQPYPEWLSFLNTLAGQAAIAIENATLFENLERSNNELSQAYDATIEGWSRALDLRDKETEGHTQRVTEMTIKLAQAFGVPEEDVLHVRRGALLHDIGKMGVPDHILLKPGELTEEEWERMRTHPEYAYNLLKPIAFLGPALDIPYCHHEKWDGTGYPRRLKGQEIPLAARLFSVVDVWDAIRSDRPYRPAWTKAKALEHIQSLSGTYFDPNIVEAFLNILKEQ
jgi:PAS domain S-box-containing protein/putative nucleotidyltransferase with HDIG domain